MIIPWVAIPLKPNGPRLREDQEDAREQGMLGDERTALQDGILIQRMRASRLQGKDFSWTFSIPPISPCPPPFCLSPSIYVLPPLLLPPRGAPAALLCNLIHLVMAPDQYPFSLASGRQSWMCLFQAVVLASRGSHGPAGWYRCGTPPYPRKRSKAHSESHT